MELKLTAILCADVAGYSRLMGDDEEATIHTPSAYRKIIGETRPEHCRPPELTERATELLV